MITDHMYDVGFEFLEDGTARLEQSAGSLEGSTYIDLHPVQVRLLAERMGLLNAQPLSLPADKGNGKFQHLEIECDTEGMIHLYQTRLEGMGGSDEHVTLHPLQAAWLAQQGNVSQSGGTIPKGTLRRIRALHDRIERFYSDEVFRSEIVERCGYGLQIMDAIDEICAWSQEVVDDLTDLAMFAQPDIPSNRNSLAKSNDKSPPIIVTESQPSKRGRPATGEALTNAERQKNHRERKSEQGSLPLPTSSMAMAN